ncbi:MAG: primary-amine oxidase, partial [Sciscionella sp.]
MTTIDARPSTATHPLDMVTEQEIRAVKRILTDAGLLSETVRYAFCAPEEPDKTDVLAHRSGEPVDRRFRVLLLDLATGDSKDAVVSTSRSAVDSVVELETATGGQLPIIDAEFDLIEQILVADPRWCAALARRDLDPATVRAVPLSAGAYGDPDEVGRRVVRAFGFYQAHEKDHPWAHPVDGLVAYVDLTRRQVTKVIDHRMLPVPAEPGNFDDPEQTGPQRDTLKPIEISQPQGPSFTLDG